MRRIGVTLLILGVVLMAGCRSTKPVVEKPAAVDSTKEQSTVATPPVQQPPAEYYEGTFDGSYNGVSVSGLLRMEKDSVIWVSLSKFIEMGRAIATPDSVHVYVKVMGKYFHGTYADLAQKSGLRMDFATLQQLLLKQAASKQDSEVCLPRNKGKICGHLHFKKFQRTEPLTFPISIPASAKELF